MNNLNFNKPLVTANRLRFDLDYYNLNSPNSYKRSYCTSTFCRNYKKPKMLYGIFDKTRRSSNYNDFFKNADESTSGHSKVNLNTLYKSKLFDNSKKNSYSLFGDKFNEFFEMDYNSGYKQKSSLCRNITTIQDLKRLLQK